MSRLDQSSACKIELAINHMLQYVNQPLRVSDLSSKAEVSTSHFFALFKHATGSSPISFFIRLRIRRACELLQETNFSVKQVAAALGYRDPFYFSRTFKSVKGVAPRQYRLLMASFNRSRPRNNLSGSAKQDTGPYPPANEIIAQVNRNEDLVERPVDRRPIGGFLQSHPFTAAESKQAVR